MKLPENQLTDLRRFLMEELETEESFKEFSGKRLKGATKIAHDAKEKGGPSMLTFHHFAVKLPYYKKAEEGKMDIEKAKEEYDELVKKLSKAGEDVKMTQTEFQKLVGKIEVLGELIIKSK